MEKSLAVRLKGIAASPGLAMGRPLIYGRKRPHVSKRSIPGPEVPGELLRWKDALEKTMDETKRLRAKVQHEAGESLAEIFSAHLLMLSDPLIAREVERKIHEEKVNAEHALIRVTGKLKSQFQSMKDPYLKLRATDIQDLEDRLLSHLVGYYLFPPSPSEPSILVAHELRPSEVVQLDRKKIVGLALESGSRTSHSIILARSMNIPAVVGLNDASKRIAEEEFIILDGNQGELISEPAPEMVLEYQRRQEKEELSLLELEEFRALPTVTRDGKEIRLLGNVTQIGEAISLLEASAEGIGLLRSEFLFLDRRILPQEEEQYETYRRIAEIMGERPTVIRTIDAGGDNPLFSIPQRREENPFLGTRSLRLCFEHPDILRTQLRAILRAARWGNLKVILPMVATVGDLQEALGLLREAEQELTQEGLPFKEGIEVGVMLEVPSAALTVDLLIPEVDFFSIGTNDLFQYALAIDRTNETLASRYGALDPAIFRLIKGVIEATRSAGKPLSVCGEMAGETLALPLLVGLGVEELSMSVSALLPARRVIRQMSVAKARELVEVCLRERTATGIEKLCAEFLDQLV
jgi:phosphoenolpyruvate-protein phosphotransferase (PTS system enzyme I)